MTRRNLSALLLAFAFSSSVFGENQLTIVSDSKSDYQIVIPDKAKKNQMDDAIEKTAKLMQSCIEEAGNAVLPILEESKLLPGKPCIYLGDTEKARNTGIDTSKMEDWEYVFKTDGKDILIIGKDLKGPADPETLQHPWRYTAYALGTLKAVTSFLESYAGTRFVMPGPNGIAVEKKTVIEVPDNLNIRNKTFFKYCIGLSSGDVFYDLANNLYPTVRYGHYGGHSHPIAIPQDKYYKEHPEYFALIKGKRYKTSDSYPHNQYCLSNPEVQELIYKELLRKLDAGYDYAQLSQSDGFKDCECDKCKDLYGVGDFGEKLWIMHKKMAERLLEDRPGKKVVILSYGPTSNPPKTFKDFPENVIVELCNYDPEDLGNWKKYKVPGGFTAYTYNWGNYLIEGYTPKRTPEFCKEQVDLFRKNNVWGIYCCSRAELYGLEGPVHYTYGKLLADSAVAPELLVDEYCRSAYRESSASMKPFFSLLHERLKIQYLPSDRKDTSGSVKILLLRYPSDVMGKLETYLVEAEKKAKEKKEIFRLKIVRIEFDYLKKTAIIVELFESCIKNPSKELSAKLVNAVKERNAFIANLPKEGKPETISPCEGCKIFGSNEAKTVMAGGRNYALLKGPYKWFTPGANEITVPRTDTPVKIDGTADEPVWGKAEKEKMLSVYMGEDIDLPETTVQASYDDNALYVLLHTNKPSPEKLKKEKMTNSFYIFLKNSKSMESLYMFTASSTDRNTRTYKHVSTGNLGAVNEFKASIETNEKIDFACITDKKTGNMTAEFRIPFSIYGKAPGKGDSWYGNFLWRIANEEKPNFFWAPNVSAKTWRNRHRYDVIGLAFQ